MIVRTRPNLLTLLFTLRGSIVPRVAPKLAGIVAVSCAVVWAESRWPALFPVSAGVTPFTVVGLALSIFLSFRNNACYERWWEARKHWGNLIGEVRNLARALPALLRGLAVIDDGAPRADDPEHPVDPALLRMEAKLDVLTLLMTGFAASQGALDAPVDLTWSARGAEVLVQGAFAIGSEGTFRMAASEWLPTPLMLPASVIASEAGDGNVTRVWLRFGPLSPSMEDALERHVFRIHRREVAEIRRR